MRLRLQKDPTMEKKEQHRQRKKKNRLEPRNGRRTSATRRQAKNSFLAEPLLGFLPSEMPRTNAATGDGFGGWGKQAGMGMDYGVTGELVLEQGRGIKRSKQHEAAVQCVSPFSSQALFTSPS